jgi:hypothetical protein
MWVKLTQQKKGLPAAMLALHVVAGGVGELVVAGLHPLTGQRSRVLDPLLPDPAPTRVLLRVVLGRRPATEHPARAEPLPELLETVFLGVVGVLRVFLGVQVVQVSEELVEPVYGRQELVLVPQMVLTELRGRVAVVLQELGDRRILGAQPDRRRGKPHLAEPGAEDALSRDERRASRGAALLAVGVREAHPLVRDPVDVRGAVAHQPVAVAAEVRDPDVVAPDHEDVRPVCHQAVAPSPLERG